MSYSEFALPTIVKAFQLILNERTDLFAQVPELALSEYFAMTLKEHVPLALAINTEKARSELIIAVMLVELRKRLDYRISVFSGVELNVDAQQGLHGVCDFIITRSAEQLFVSAPVLIIVEAKNENITGGLGQCIAAMLAARLFNAREGQDIPTVYGAVTSGSVWKFLQLVDNTVYIDLEEYHINNAGKILGILVYIAEGAWALLPV
ncbi:MAG: hypothetical protein FJZ47_00585 [Candidatus Tectomicrobia bacterium]|uniref:Uncharacterized protein n=1 Tax=Tectimicrobiota bacterium TaxID=2528274 RepID=A0A937VWE3_UNCTE|nr:hypothetical protein [Candidatus Tectomicrobia bacterium]